MGVTLWELSADRRLFKEEVDEETVRRVRDAIVDDPTTFVPDYPSLLWLVLKRALAREPDERYATAADLARDLDGVARVEGSILQAATLADIMRALFTSGPATSTYLVPTNPQAPLAIPTPTPARTLVKRPRPWMQATVLAVLMLTMLLGGIALGMASSKP